MNTNNSAQLELVSIIINNQLFIVSKNHVLKCFSSSTKKVYNHSFFEPSSTIPKLYKYKDLSNSLICSEKESNNHFNKSTSNKENRSLVQQQYLSAKTNHLICVDVTVLHKKDNDIVFCAIDVTSRCVIGHCFVDRKMCVTDVIKTVYQILKDRDFLPNVKIVDSNRGFLSKNQAYIEFIGKKGIKVSKASTKGHANNVIKRFFRTFKQYIRKRLNLSFLSLHNKNIDLYHL